VSQHDFAGARWIKSSRSTTQNSCLELARIGTTIGVRDSKNGDAGPILELAPTGFAAFIAATKAGELV
jgi:hypothetical protein